jgi:hypothetical protein
MATTPATSTTPGEESGRTPEQRERAGRKALEHLHQASIEIGKARQEATSDVRRSLDSALERLHEASDDLRQRTVDQTTEWQDALEHANDEVRREMGRRAIRAQRTPEALKDLSSEIRKRQADLGPAASKGHGGKR